MQRKKSWARHFFSVFVIAIAFWAACSDPPEAPPERQEKTVTQPAIGDFVLYAERGITLGSDATVTGAIGVAMPAQASYGTQLVIGSGSEVQNLYAPTLWLGSGGAVGYMAANTVVLGPSPNGPFPIGSMPPLPLSVAGSVSTKVTEITSNTTLEANENSYGQLIIDSAKTLTLSGGDYSFSSVTMGSGAHMIASAATTIHVAGTFSAGDTTSVAASPPTLFRIDISGEDSSGSGSGSGSDACTFGANVNVGALVSVPHGTVLFGIHPHGTGAFAADRIIAGTTSVFALSGGFPAVSTGELGSQQLSGYFGAQMDVASLVGPVLGSAAVHLSIGLPARNGSDLAALADSVSDPTNPNYKHYITTDQFNSLYGGSATDYTALESWATSSGFTISNTYGNNLLLAVDATASQVEQALHTNLVYRVANDGSSSFIAVDREPSLDLSPQILQISGLDGYLRSVPNSYYCPDPSDPPVPTEADLTAQQLRDLYLGTNSTCSGLTGAGQVVGIAANGVFDASDITGFIAGTAETGLTIPISPGTVGGPIIGVKDGWYPGYQVTWANLTSNQVDDESDETSMDVELVLAMAPQAKVIVYQGDKTWGNDDDVVEAMATEPSLTVATSSWSAKYTSNVEQALRELAVRGVTFFNAAGDYGNVGDPGDWLHGTYQTIVGGTHAVEQFPPFTEATWNNGCSAAALTVTGITLLDKDITGGGVMDGESYFREDQNWGQGCTCFPEPRCCADSESEPNYQKPINMMTNGGSTAYRNFPDVAAMADGVFLHYTYNGNQSWYGNGGTSAAAPIWAGFTAAANQFAEAHGTGPVGFANPVLYAISEQTALYSTTFDDIADGVYNQLTPDPVIAGDFGIPGYPAVAGYDLATGLGSPRCGLIEQLGINTPLGQQTYPWIAVHVDNGHDGLGDGVAVYLDVFDSSLPGGGPITVPVKASGIINWDTIGVAHDIAWPAGGSDSPWPGHMINPFDVTDVKLRIETTDPTEVWDIAGINVTLMDDAAPSTPGACLVNINGNDYFNTTIQTGDPPGAIVIGAGQPLGSSVDISISQPASGSSAVWGGCPAWQGPTSTDPITDLEFTFDTGGDDMDIDSQLSFDIIGSGSSFDPNNIIESGTIQGVPGVRWPDQTQYRVVVSLGDNSNCPGCVPLNWDDIGGIVLHFSPDNDPVCIGSVCTGDDWDVEEVAIHARNDQAWDEDRCIAQGPPGVEHNTWDCIAPCTDPEWNAYEYTDTLPLQKNTGCSYIDP